MPSFAVFVAFAVAVSFVAAARKTSVFDRAKAVQAQESAQIDKIVAVIFLIHFYYSTLPPKKQEIDRLFSFFLF